MTMLARMRRHRNWLKWSLAIVVLTFAMLYVPQFLDPTAGAAPSDVMATVNGREIKALAYQRAYAQQVAQLRANYPQATDDLIRQMQIGQRIVQQLVSQEAVVAEAERMGITVGTGELRERLLRLPAFQENGQFVGEARYRQMLEGARPPVRPAEFEADLHSQIMGQKLQSTVTGWIRVTDAEVDQEYRNQNEKVKLDLAVLNASQFKTGLSATDAELTAEFTTNADTYKMPEKRRVKYLSIDAGALRDTMTVTPQETQARYDQNAAGYSTPEQVRASHILFKTEGKDEAAVRKQAESVLARVKAGGDFAALAKQYSEDSSKDAGGDLDFFGKGTMVPEFEQAAWTLKPGETSGLVKSQFGFHIIKLTDRRAAITRTLDQVKPQIEDQIKTEKAQAEATRVAASLAGEIKAQADLGRIATARGWAVGDSGLFSREEPLAGLGYSPAAAAEAFRLEKDAVSGQIRTNQGYVFLAVTEIAPPAMPTLDAAKDKVRDAVVTRKAVAMAAAKAATIARAGASFAAAAKSAGVTVKTTDLITRRASLPDIGVSDAVDNVVFRLKAGETSQPIETASAVVVAHVKEHTDIDPKALEGERDTLRGRLTQTKRAEFFQAYMAKAMDKMTVDYNQVALRALLGN